MEINGSQTWKHLESLVSSFSRLYTLLFLLHLLHVELQVTPIQQNTIVSSAKRWQTQLQQWPYLELEILHIHAHLDDRINKV